MDRRWIIVVSALRLAVTQALLWSALGAGSSLAEDALGVQSSEMRKVISGGYTPGAGSGDLRSSYLVKLCNKQAFSSDDVEIAVLHALREYYVAERQLEALSNTSPSLAEYGAHFESQRFILKKSFVEQHNEMAEQVSLPVDRHYSMQILLSSKIYSAASKMFMRIETRLFIGRSNNTDGHTASGDAYDGAFFHQHFVSLVERELVSQNCASAS